MYMGIENTNPNTKSLWYIREMMSLCAPNLYYGVYLYIRLPTTGI